LGFQTDKTKEGGLCSICNYFQHFDESFPNFIRCATVTQRINYYIIKSLKTQKHQQSMIIEGFTIPEYFIIFGA